MVLGFSKKIDISDASIKQIKSTLSELQEPNFNRTLGDLGFIGTLEVKDKALQIQLKLPTPALLGLDSLKAHIEASV